MQTLPTKWSSLLSGQFSERGRPVSNNKNPFAVHLRHFSESNACAKIPGKMPTNRPFFANFFAAFRAHTNPTFQAKSSSPSSAVSPTSLVATAHVSTTTTTVTSSNPRTITTKATDAGTHNPNNPSITSPTRATTSPFSAAAAAAATASSHRYVPPLSRSPGTSSPNGPHNMSMSPPGASTPLTRGRQRRGSDSSNSSGGFMDALGPEKWYIGGRTATGEEKFYRLGLVTGASGRRVRSLDRLSL